LLEDAIPIALAAESKGAQVIISRGGTTRLLERSALTIPVVDIAVSPFNILSAIHRTQPLNRRITVMGSVRIIRGVERLGRILNVDLEIHEIYNCAEAQEYVRSRMQSENPIEVLIGGAVAESLAYEYNLPTVFLETSREDIETSLEEAYKLLEVKRIEAQKTEQFKAILDNINHGVIAVDKAGGITTFNKAAGKITGIEPLSAEGKRIQNVLSQDTTQAVVRSGRSQLGELLQIGRTMVLSNKVPVKVGDEIAGAAETLEDVTKIREYENIIRLKMAEKGHISHFTFGDIIGDSPPFTKIIKLAQKFAEVDSQEVDLGKFRSDLYYRLNILRLNIPPLRYRNKDIPHFVRHFIGHNGAKMGKGLSITQKAMTTLKKYNWPGNIRELQNVIERLCDTCDLKIDEHLVIESLDDCQLDDTQGVERIDCLKKNHILDVLRQCGNNKREAAEKLGISRTTLWRELKRSHRAVH
jgi:PAS domain S-box-containing protein